MHDTMAGCSPIRRAKARTAVCRMVFHHTILATICFCLILLSVAGCDHKMDLSTLPQSQIAVLDTAYIAVDPVFGGFSGPEDILIGRDQLLYVADTRANRVVMMNLAGQFMSSRSIIHPFAIAQDSRLDLLVGCEIIAATGDTTGAILRMHLVSQNPDSAHHLEVSPIDTVWRERAHPARRFPGIAVLSDNTYLASRTGPDNSSFIDPDGRVLMFAAQDRFITPVPAFATGVGTGIGSINFLTGITAFPNSRDFVLIQSSEGIAYGALWMVYQSNADFQGWLPRFDPANASDRAVDFIRPNRFVSPQGVAIDPSRRDIFIADAGLDSIFKFNSRGVFKSESFGRVRTDGIMRRPTGIAYFSTILYVLDRDLGMVLRFRLSTDVPR